MNHISILQLSDTHILEATESTLLGVNTAYYFEKVLESAVNSGRKFDLCLVTGDLAQDPNLASYQYLLNGLQKLDVPCTCLPGNHDDLAIMQTVFASETINCRKQIILGNWQVVCLYSQIPDSADGYLAQPELLFLEQCLQEYPDLFTLIAVHHHSVPCGSQWMDTMMIENAQELFDLIEPYPMVKAIINGHIHQEMDFSEENVRVLSAPSTCFQFTPHSEKFSLDTLSPGYRCLNLYPDGALTSDVTRIPEKLTGLQADTEGY